MKVRFYVNSFRQLAVEEGGERDILIAARFMQSENQDRCADYLRGVAAKLTDLYGTGQVDQAGDLLAEAEAKVRNAQTAESFLEEVRF